MFSSVVQPLRRLSCSPEQTLIAVHDPNGTHWVRKTRESRGGARWGEEGDSWEWEGDQRGWEGSLWLQRILYIHDNIVIKPIIYN